jgi:TolB-like protein
LSRHCRAGGIASLRPGRKVTASPLNASRFENKGADPDTEYLALGIPGSIIHSLSQLPNLRVIAGSTFSAHKDQEFDLQLIGRKLSVRTVLTGRIWHRNGRLRLQVDLVDTANGQELWGNQYDRDLTELFSVQDEIAREVSHELRLRLTGEEAARLVRRHTQSLEAYQLYLRGRHTQSLEAYQLYLRGRGNSEKRSTEGFKKGVECLTEAIRKDPNYALAYAELAQCVHMPAY